MQASVAASCLPASPELDLWAVFVVAMSETVGFYLGVTEHLYVCDAPIDSVGE